MLCAYPPSLEVLFLHETQYLLKREVVGIAVSRYFTPTAKYMSYILTGEYQLFAIIMMETEKLVIELEEKKH